MGISWPGARRGALARARAPFTLPWERVAVTRAHVRQLLTLRDRSRVMAEFAGSDTGATKIDGKVISEQIHEELADEIKNLQAECNLTPGLAVVLVGTRPDSESYVRMKKKCVPRAYPSLRRFPGIAPSITAFDSC